MDLKLNQFQEYTFFHILCHFLLINLLSHHSKTLPVNIKERRTAHQTFEELWATGLHSFHKCAFNFARRDFNITKAIISTAVKKQLSNCKTIMTATRWQHNLKIHKLYQIKNRCLICTSTPKLTKWEPLILHKYLHNIRRNERRRQLLSQKSPSNR
jgi:hypothetical protein